MSAPSEGEIARAIEANVTAYWLSLARAAGGSVHHGEDVTWGYTGRPVLNRVVTTDLDEASADACIDEVVREFGRRGAGFAWLVGPSSRPADLARRLEAHGFDDAGTRTGMALDLTTNTLNVTRYSGPPPRGLVIREVHDDASERDWLDVVGTAFELPRTALDVLRDACARPPVPSGAGAPEPDGTSTWRRLVGYVDEQPVATATLVPAAGVAGVYLVGTLPHEEHQGLGTALTRHVLRLARDEGFGLAVLEVAPPVHSLYAAMGFEEHCRIGVYRWSPPRGIVRRVLGRVRRTVQRVSGMALTLVTAAAVIGCGPEAGPPQSVATPRPPAVTPTAEPTPVPPTPTPDLRGAIAERRRVAVFSPQQINALLPRLYPAGTSLPAKHAVEQHTLRFTTIEESGEPVQIVAQLFVPQMSPPATLPVLVYGAGTTGLADQCAPSRELPTVRNWGDYITHMLSYASQGYIAILPDYAGFNDEARINRYFIAVSEARVMLDASRAVYRYLQESPLAQGSRGWAVFLAGYSVGGHAAFAARDIVAQYAPDIPLKGVIGHGASTDLTALLKDSPYFAPYVLFSLQDYYSPAVVDVSKLLATRWLPTLAADMGRLCIDQMPGYYGNTPQALYQPAFSTALFNDQLATAFPTLKEALDKNSTGLVRSDIPALVIQGATDPIVQTRSQDAFVAKLCAARTRVTYVNYPGVHHFQTRQTGFKETLAFMETLLGGGNPRTTC